MFDMNSKSCRREKLDNSFFPVKKGKFAEIYLFVCLLNNVFYVVGMTAYNRAFSVGLAIDGIIIESNPFGFIVFF